MTVAEISHAIQNSAFFTDVRQSELFYPTVMATHLTCIAIRSEERRVGKECS